MYFGNAIPLNMSHHSPHHHRHNRMSLHQSSHLHLHHLSSSSSTNHHRSNRFLLLCIASLSLYYLLLSVPLSHVSGAIIHTSASAAKHKSDSLAAATKSPLLPTVPYTANHNTSWNISFPYLPVVNVSANHNWTDNCPCRLCETSAKTGYRQIICDTGPIFHLPIYQIPPHIELIEILGSAEKENNLTLGPLFYRFPELKVLRVLYSNVPAIGQTTFRYKTSLTHLDLSHNVIQNLIDANFKGLRKLEMLNLSYNRLTDLTSAPFQHLISLQYLNLSHNRLKMITTRLFYNLTQIESLDLSANPITEITPQNTIDLRPLRRLYMSHCQLKELHSLFYRNVPNLEVLDLRFNQIGAIHKHEFRHLPNLTELRLDGNRLVVIPAAAFYGNHLSVLGLGGNVLLVQLHSDAFQNSTVVELDLSSGNFTHFDPNTFGPLANCLKVLDLSNIRSLIEPSATIASLIAPLSVLQEVNLSNLTLESITLPVNLFANHRQSLQFLNLSHNALTQLNSKLVDEMTSLMEIDLSYNSLYELDSDFLYLLSTFANLTYAYFDHNPWSCFRCHLLYFRNWISASDRPSNAYQNACQFKNRCAECQYPPNLEGYQIHQMEEWQLEWCTDPTVQLRVSTTEPNVGLVLALLIIIILIIVIVGVIVYYRNRGAIYFTNEDLLYGRTSSTHEEGDHPGGHGSGGTEDAKSSSTVYNLSSRIRYFAEATASPPESHRGSHSIRSASSIDSVDHHRGLTEAKKPMNGYAKTQPIMNSILGGGAAAAAATHHRDSTNTQESQKSNGIYAKPVPVNHSGTGTILRKPVTKKQSSTASSTSSRGTASIGRKGPPYSRGGSNEEENGVGGSGHYERVASSRYRALKSKSSSLSEDEEQEESRPKRIPPQPPLPPIPPMAPRGTKPPIPPKKVSLATKPKITTSNISLSSTSSSDDSKPRPSPHRKSDSDSSSSGDASSHNGTGSHSRPRSLPSALRPYDEAARSSAEVEDVDEDDDDEDDIAIISGESSPATEQRRRGPRTGSAREDSSPDSSTAALAEGGSTSPSSTRSSDFTTKSPITD